VVKSKGRRTYVLDTSVLLAAGSGADAVIAPEMLAFARTLGAILASRRTCRTPGGVDKK